MKSQPNDPTFYAAREAQERQLAADAKDPAIAAIHLALADRYAQLQDPAGATPLAGRAPAPFLAGQPGH
jgi:hypothetical protein